MTNQKRIESPPTSGATTPDVTSPPPSVMQAGPPPPENRFRHAVAEFGFCFTIAMTQFLAEYMISGFAIELPKLITRHTSDSDGGMGKFWPASLLSLILSATLLIFARISDMYGGYFPFMFGVMWLGVWSLVAGFAELGTLLDVARAMQGLAIAAFTPATFAMVGSIYPEGPRKNTVLGLYAGCAPLGFFGGFLVAGALPESASGWYFWIAAVLAFTTAITAYLTVPHDRTDRKQLGLKMDWCGAVLITAGLILLAYALAVEPYANVSNPAKPGWSFATVLGPLVGGVACLATAFWVEGWYAKCPLLPFDFFKPTNTEAFSLACLCFYATYGVWLYESAQFFQNAHATGTQDGIHGITLAIWYTPTAVGGLLLCVLSGRLLHIVPVTAALLVSALAWIASPLLLALCPLPLNYWAYVMPSMLCATLGIDLTFTISCVFLSATQPLRYQGLAGAMSSILVNLAMSFSLSISEIVSEKAEREMWGFRTAFIYGAASAGIGLIVCVLFVRISRTVVNAKPEDEERTSRSRPSSEVSTLVDGSDQ
ncbi:hypothetical protein DOTSEDRAFT_177826 [Dothistroma septosporum NZE10]|uniref:Major facilitator superfamily (MFS) profile domain-containing protein n=1 Tax=Dothistroma septosporum (strain NZE10 / CBS 128990) TaxID=675120 RepID=N1PDN4_DOTSN|nr:hypothetical protein DOTSEDRAFT_177826 [Dothistroma septosporum NZE10]